MKNSGGFKVRNGIIYVFGAINKIRYRFSTNKSAELLERSFTKNR